MGRMQKRKGSRVEREIVNYLKDNEIPAKRVPLSGSANGFKGDIIIGDSLKCEVKARKDGFKQIYNWIKENDFLIVKADRKSPLVIMDIDTFIKIMRKRLRK